MYYDDFISKYSSMSIEGVQIDYDEKNIALCISCVALLCNVQK
jgi:hypothetical protein